MKIKINNISQNFYTKHDFLSEIFWEISGNKTWGIIGNNGSGKTTLIEHFNGLLSPTSGTVNIEFLNSKKLINLEITSKKSPSLKEVRKKIGLLFQFSEKQLFADTVLNDVMFAPLRKGIKKNEAQKLAKNYLKLVGLDESYMSMNPFELSNGQKRLVALAGVFAMEPDIIVFDEPTVGLDYLASTKIFEVINQLKESGKTIIIISHDLDDILKHTDKVIILKGGKKIIEGDTIDLMYDESLLVDNGLYLPTIPTFIKKANDHGLKILKHRNREELFKELENEK